MYSKNLIDFSEINFKSGVAKYKQLINHLIKKIRNNELKPNSKLPSIHELSFAYNLSRDTIERSYKYLNISTADTKVGTPIYRLRASDAEENYPLDFSIFGK